MERLRAFHCSIFTGGVVAADGICSAAFCESAAPQESGLALSVTFGDSSPKGRALGMAAKLLVKTTKLAVSPEAPPLGELDLRSKD